MSGEHWPLILIEGVLVFGGALLFGWWQLRSVRKDREAAAREREQMQETPVGEATSAESQNSRR